jgi:hypothetical protein
MERSHQTIVVRWDLAWARFGPLKFLAHGSCCCSWSRSPRALERGAVLYYHKVSATKLFGGLARPLNYLETYDWEAEGLKYFLEQVKDRALLGGWNRILERALVNGS